MDIQEKLQEAALKNASKRRRLMAFADSHNMTDRYPIKELSRWHMLMTKSCATGREAFAQRHNLDLEKGTLTVPEFIELVRKDFGATEIAQLEHLMKAKNDVQPKPMTQLAQPGKLRLKRMLQEHGVSIPSKADKSTLTNSIPAKVDKSMLIGAKLFKKS